MPSPQAETRTLADLSAILLELGVVARAADLAGAELLVGWESAVVRTPDGWIHRFGRLGDDDFARELTVLALVDGRLGIPTPRVEAVAADHRLMSYRTITGHELDLRRLIEGTTADRRRTVRSLARVLAAMHELPLDLGEGVAVPRCDPVDRTAAVRAARGTLSGADRTELDGLLADWDDRALSRPAADPVLLHSDFHLGNMLFADPVGEIAGLWDFSSVELGDPAVELRYLAGDSPALTEDLAAAYTALTGRSLDVSGARLMLTLEDLDDALTEGRPLTDVLRRR